MTTYRGRYVPAISNGVEGYEATPSDEAALVAAAIRSVSPGPQFVAPEGADKTLTILEDTPVTLAQGDFGYSDGDGEALAGITIAAPPVKGALLLNGSIVAAGTFVTVTEITSGQLVFAPAANASGLAYASFTFQTRDAAGIDDPTPNTITVNVTPVNDAPKIDFINGTTAPGYFEGAAPMLLDNPANARISDVDSTDFAGGRLRVFISLNEVAAEDVLGIAVRGGVGASGFAAGSSVSVNGTVIGTIAAGGTGRSGEDLIVELNGSANAANVQALVQALTYRNVNELNPNTASREFTIELTDGDGPQLSGVRVLAHLFPENDAPTLTDPSVYRLIHAENAPPTALFAGATVSDPDQVWNGATLNLTGGKFELVGGRFATVNWGEPALALVDTSTNQRVGSITIQGSDASVSFGANATSEIVNAVIQSFGFRPDFSYGAIARSLVSLEFVDGGVGIGSTLRDDPISQEIIILPDKATPIVDFDGGVNLGPSTQIVYDENGPAIALGQDIWILGPHLGNTIDKMTVVLYARDVGDSFTYGGLPPGVTAATTPENHITTIVFSGAATAQSYRDLLASFRFSTSADFPTNFVDRYLHVSVEHAGVSSGIVQVDLRINWIDDPAIVRDDVFTVGKNSLLDGDVLADNGAGADSDIDTALYVAKLNGVAASADFITLPSGALLRLTGSGSFRYDPNDAFAGPATDSFTYSLQNGETATVTIQITNGDAITGTSGPDTLHGTNGGEVIDGGAGNDLIFSGAGVDTLLGGSGNDGLYFGPHLNSEDHVHGGDGIDTLAIQGNYLALTLPDVKGIEVLLVASGADTRFGDTAGNSYDYEVIVGDDDVAAGATLTVIASDLRPDEGLYFHAGGENDGRLRVFAGQGVDWLGGGQGNDGFFFGADGNLTGADTVFGNAGVDSIALRGNYVGDRAVQFEDDAFSAVEVVTLLSGHTNEFGGTINPDGFDYKVTFSNGNVAQGQRLDVIATNLRANESVEISAQWVVQGSVRILSGAGDDVIVGSARSDIFYGGLGADQIDGRTGTDTFLYRSAAESTSTSRDTITFSGDKIDLSLIDAVNGTPENESFTFIGNAAFSNVAGQLRAEQVGAQWLVQADVNGDGVGDLVIGVNSSLPLTIDDFTL